MRELGVVIDLLQHRRRDQQPARPGLGQLRQPRGLVDGVTDHGVLESLLRPDVACHHETGGDADRRRQAVDIGKAVAQQPRREQRACGCVLARHRRTEDTQCGVAFELVDDAAGAVHHVDDDGEELVECCDNRRRRQRLRERSRPDDVDEEHCHVHLLAAQLHTALQRVLRHVLTDLTAEQVSQPPPLAQPVHHRVEACLQLTDLAAVVDRNRDVEPTGLDISKCCGYGLHRLGDRLRREHHRRRAGEQGNDAKKRQRRRGDRVAAVIEGHQYDADQRHPRPEDPRQQQPGLNTRYVGVSRQPIAEGELADGPQDALSEQVGQAARGDGAQQDRRGDVEHVLCSEVGVDRDEHDLRAHPQREVHPRLAQRMPDDVLTQVGIRRPATDDPVVHRLEQPGRPGAADDHR